MRSLPWEDAGVQAEAARAVVHISRTYDAPRDEVFAAWTDPVLLTQWFRPTNGRSAAELDVRPNGKYRITMDPQGDLPGPGNIVGTYLEVDPPERLVFTFGWELPPLEELTGLDGLDAKEFEARLDDLRSLDSQVTVLFRDQGGATELSITHERLATQGLRAFHLFGWTMVLDHLRDVV